MAPHRSSATFSRLGHQERAPIRLLFRQLGTLLCHFAEAVLRNHELRTRRFLRSHPKDPLAPLGISLRPEHYHLRIDFVARKACFRAVQPRQSLAVFSGSYTVDAAARGAAVSTEPHSRGIPCRQANLEKPQMHSHHVFDGEEGLPSLAFVLPLITTTHMDIFMRASVVLGTCSCLTERTFSG